MKGHKVFGEAVLPGLAYIDLIYQVFQEHGYVYNELELKHVTIYQPLTVSETVAIILTIQCSDSGDGKWLISLSGQKQQGDELSDNIQYATAEMVKRDAVTFDETIDFGDVKQSGRSLNLDDMYNRRLDHDLVHSGMMKSNGRLSKQKAACWLSFLVKKERISFIPSGPFGCERNQGERFAF